MSFRKLEVKWKNFGILKSLINIKYWYTDDDTDWCRGLFWQSMEKKQSWLKFPARSFLKNIDSIARQVQEYKMRVEYKIRR